MEFLPSHHPDRCNACSLATPERIQVVHSVLPVGARVLFIGEGPGKDESQEGKPFLGAAGRELDRAFKEVGIDRETVAIANAVACRPMDAEGANRKPTPKECKTCFPYLDMEIRELKPEVIVTLGATPLSMILPNIGSVTKIRGRWFKHPTYECKVMPTLHPAYVLRDPRMYGDLRNDLARVAEYLRSGIADKPAEPVYQYIVTNKEEFDWWIGELLTQEIWAFDIETTGLDFFKDEMFIITTSWQENTSVLLDFRNEFVQQNQEYVWEQLKLVMAGPAKKVLHNGSFDVKFFLHRGIAVNNYYADTLLMHHLLDENTFHGLEVLTMAYTDRAGYDQELMQWTIEHKTKNYGLIPNEIIYPYALLDADVTFRSYCRMLPKIYEEGLDFVFFNITMPTTRMLLEVELNGVFVDRNHLKKMQEEYGERLEKLAVEIANDPNVVRYEEDKQVALTQQLFEKYNSSQILKNKFATFELYRQSKKPKDATFTFNSNSTPQLRELFIDRLNMDIIKETLVKKKKSGRPSIDEEVLRKYAQRYNMPLCENLADHRQISHVRSIFLDGFEPHIHENGKVHTNYLVFGTVSGRPSSRNPNLNNIPRGKTAEGIKDLFVADPGQWMVEVDGAQAEFRMWINYSLDPQALRDLANGLDIHKLVCALSKGVNIPKRDITKEEFAEFTKDVTKEERQATKPVVFGLMYGLAAETLAKDLNMPQTQAAAIVGAFFGRYPKAKAWLYKTVARAKRDEYVTNLFGRRRRVPGINAKEAWKRSHAERMAKNSPIQGGTSDVVLWAGVRILEELKSRNLKTRMLLTVYDSLVYSVPTGELEIVATIVAEEMKRPIVDSIKVNLEAEVKVGRSWGKLQEIDMRKPWGEEFSRVCQVLGTVQRWYYHPESESYLTMFEDEFGRDPEDGLLVDLGPVETGEITEAYHLHGRGA